MTIENIIDKRFFFKFETIENRIDKRYCFKTIKFIIDKIYVRFFIFCIKMNDKNSLIVDKNLKIKKIFVIRREMKNKTFL